MKKLFILATLLLTIALVFAQSHLNPSRAAEPLNIQQTIVYADNYTGTSDSDKIQKAIDFAAQKGNPKTVLLADRDYSLTKPIVIKTGVKLVSSHGTRLVVDANFRVLELQRNASLIDAYIAINAEAFNSDVIYLDGAQKYYNSWNKTKVEDINIVNWTGSHKGNGISLNAAKKGDEISFVKFENIKIAGMGTAIKLTAAKPSGGYAYINANSFNNIIIDDVVSGIILSSSETVPNEASGNTFTNIQFQLSSATKEAIRVTGQYNRFEGMIWDTQTLSTKAPVINLTNQSSYSDVSLRGSLRSNHVSNAGNNNKVGF
jgi:hypothetical protein